MNCTQVEKLLPLYVEGDLADAASERALVAHLEACGACRASRSAWLESQKLLRLHEPPEFDVAFFADVRRAVLRRIDDEPARTPLALFFAPLFSRRALAFAASAALLLLAAAVLLQLRRSDPHAPVEQGARHESSPVAGVLPAPQAHDANTSEGTQTLSSDQTQTRRVPERPGTNAQALASTNERLRRASSPASPSEPRTLRTGVAATGAQPREQPVQPALHEAQPERASLGGAGSASVAAVKSSVTRLEFQTSDRNIRIIWLSPQAGDASTPKQSHDNR